MTKRAGSRIAAPTSCWHTRSSALAIAQGFGRCAQSGADRGANVSVRAARVLKALARERRDPLRTRWFVLGFVAMILRRPWRSDSCSAAGGRRVPRHDRAAAAGVAATAGPDRTCAARWTPTAPRLKTLVQQSLDSVSKLNGQMDALQKSVQEVQANTGARIEHDPADAGHFRQRAGHSGARRKALAAAHRHAEPAAEHRREGLGRRARGGAPTGAPGGHPARMLRAQPRPRLPALPARWIAGARGAALPPISADTLYQNALRDYTSGKYDLAQQEFSDYIRISRRTTWRRTRSFISAKSPTRKTISRPPSRPTTKCSMQYPKSFKLAASC